MKNLTLNQIEFLDQFRTEEGNSSLDVFLDEGDYLSAATHLADSGALESGGKHEKAIYKLGTSHSGVFVHEISLKTLSSYVNLTCEGCFAELYVKDVENVNCSSCGCAVPEH